MPKKTNFNALDIQNMIKLYADGYSTNKIATKYGVVKSTIGKILIKNGIKLSNPQKITFTKENQNEIISMYSSNIGTPTIAKKFNTTYVRIIKELRMLNIPVKEKHHPYILYKHNENTFSSIDSHEKAYWVGFLTGDGSILDKYNCVAIDLASSDEDHVNKFKIFLQSEHPINNYTQICKFTNKPTYHSVLRVRSKQMVKDLISLGVKPRKSLKEEFPLIDSKYYNSFILGLVDADGSWFTTNQRNHYMMHFSLMSGISIIEKINNILINNCKLNNNKITKLKLKLGIGGVIRFSGKQLIGLYNYLYKDSPVWLERKRQIIDKYVRSISS